MSGPLAAVRLPQPAHHLGSTHAAHRQQCRPAGCIRGVALWQRRRRAAALRVQAAGDLPTIDWTRRSVQQMLFVDRSDTVRARFAVGMFERVTGWVGCSRILQAYPCGMEAEPGSHISWSTQASLFGLASSWKVRPHLFTSARQRWEEEDIDRFELVVCLDSSVQADLLRELSSARPSAPGSYVTRICCLTDFLMYCDDEVLLGQGSTALLDRQLRGLMSMALPLLRPSATKVAAAAAATGGAVGSSASAGLSSIEAAARAAAAAAAAAGVLAIPAYMLPTGIQRPPLQGSGGATASRDDDGGSSDGSGGGADAVGSDETGSGEIGGDGIGGGGSSSERWERQSEWERMGLLMAVCCAGLVKYLLDCRGDDAPDG